MDYTHLFDIPSKLGIEKGSKIFVNANISTMVSKFCKYEENVNLNVFIDSFIKAIGETGTLIFPTYNWDWCKGKDFDYYTTASESGELTQEALRRPDFKRTKHPVYSFAVWGADQEVLCELNNQSAFGSDSLFDYFKENNVLCVILDESLSAIFPFIHYVEERHQNFIPFRYMRNYRSRYKDEKGNLSYKTYSLFIDSNCYQIKENIKGVEKMLLKEGVATIGRINNIPYKIIDLAKSYSVFLRDIIDNKCKNLYSGVWDKPKMSEGEIIYNLVKELYPICSSITGEGFRNRINIIKSYLPDLQIFEVKSGTEVYDWIIPPEWNIYEAYLEDNLGRRVVDFRNSNLHVLGYSQSVDINLDKNELSKYIYLSEADQADSIPYVTSFYQKRVGLCMSRSSWDSLPNASYHLYIRSEFNYDGTLTYGELFFPGKAEKEILITSYCCHPSMANNECSGPAVATFLARYINELRDRKYSYRFLFIPETIGSITWLNQNYKKKQLRKNIIAGFVLNCIGDERTYSFVKTKNGNTLTDRALELSMKYHTKKYESYSFLERGSDERQFNSVGIDLPVCSVCRSKFETYPEYHTSADDLTIVTPGGLVSSLSLMKKIVNLLEENDVYKMTVQCEPQLGKRGLYPTISEKGLSYSVKNITNFIAYCDGTRDIIDICEIIQASPEEVIEIAHRLKKENLIEPVC